MRIPLVPSLLLVGALTGCSTPFLEPCRIDPPSLNPLTEPLSAGVLAVLDLEDRRPEHERKDVTLSDTFLTGRVPPGSFWSFQGEETKNLPTVRDAEGRRRFLRFTGDRAWTWHPYPAAGPLGDRSVPANVGLADLVAHLVGSRGVLPRVIRVASMEQAQQAQATWVLSGAVDHFASVFEEAEATDREAPEAVRRFRVTPLLDLELSVTHDGAEVWRSSYSAPVDAVFSNLQDHFGSHRTAQVGDAALLDPRDFPRMAFEDMTAGVHRELSELLLRAVAELEGSLAAEPTMSPD